VKKNVPAATLFLNLNLSTAYNAALKTAALLKKVNQSIVSAAADIRVRDYVILIKGTGQNME